VLKRFELHTGSATFTYRIQYPEQEFMYPKYRYGLQIEPSWRIYAIQDSEMPVSTFPAQPKGYPLVHE
jgi:hypothetical protein